MFDSESKLQKLIHENPEIILSGILEINPQYCPDTPSILSLGREIPLNSGPIDNLYIDTNAIITLVECKRYGDSRIKREVYSQAINYASDLQNMLIHYTSGQFCEEFFKIISKGQQPQFSKFQEIIDSLSKDPILNNRNKSEWESQFIQRLEYNIKAGIFRIVIACAPAPDNNFSYSAIRNLIQLMHFSESGQNKYDLFLLDVREENNKYVSKIIWRRFTLLPQIPLIAQAIRDTSLSVEAMRNKYAQLPVDKKATLDKLIEYLNDNNTYLKDNTLGFAIYSLNRKKSLYISIDISDKGWIVKRHQIRSGEKLFEDIENQEISELLSNIKYSIETKKSSISGNNTMYDIICQPSEISSIHELGKSIIDVLGYEFM
jgi:hypothetical protein